MDVSGRVARLLIDLAQETGGKLVVARAPAKQEIARMIGASREMVSRMIKELEQRALIRIDRRSIIILDREMTKVVKM